ncbi:MAG: arsenate reductase family protein [Sulfuricurvum sp.]|nr:arsenate reductase family protein [Sulfuricurvum sp.]MDP3023759.1 arsenate reductase family protein [Sulfuricurvum sp.]MDP3119091.1 arsenate reductase family protein [Sulfuricurvum sp.]
MVTLYGIKNCDSVKKALKFLNERSIPYNFVDFKISPVDINKINAWLTHVDISVLLNTKGTTYRTLNLKSLDLNDNDKAQWMSKENLLIKRPVIEYNSNIIVGFDLSKYEGIFHP